MGTGPVPDYLVGCDLGQVSDPTAACVVRRCMLLTEDNLPDRDHRRRPRFKYDCIALQRYALGTSYPEIVSKVASILDSPRIPRDSRLVLDSTGVGRAVTDLFLDARLSAQIVPVTLTAGREVKRERWNRSRAVGFWVPKSEVVGTTQALLSTGRLKIAKSLPLADVLKKELLDFRMKVSATGHESFNAREGAHDDVLLAVSIACWLGERHECHYRPTEPNDTGRLALDEEERHESAVFKAEAEAEKEARQREWMNPNNPALWTRSF
jgi:hypothetical protein